MIHLKVVTRVFLFKKFFFYPTGEKVFPHGVLLHPQFMLFARTFNLKGGTILIFQDSANGNSINDLMLFKGGSKSQHYLVKKRQKSDKKRYHCHLFNPILRYEAQ